MVDPIVEGFKANVASAQLRHRSVAPAKGAFLAYRASVIADRDRQLGKLDTSDPRRLQLISYADSVIEHARANGVRIYAPEAA